MPDAGEFQAKLRRLESLIQQAERLPDPAARTHARDLVQALLGLHAAGLERLMDHIADAGDAGDAIFAACAADEVTSGLLLLHGLHPLELEERVRRALEQVAPALRGHGTVEYVGEYDGVVRLRFDGDGNATLRKAIEDAVAAHAPDVSGVEIEGLEPATDESGRIALPLL